jgi:hypothetical protein
MQTAWLEAVINRRHRILGRELRPLCLAHSLFLTLAENPLWVGGRVPDRDALIETVHLCSLPVDRLFTAEIQPRGVLEKLWILRATRALRSDAGFAAALAAWNAFRADHDTRPEFWESDDGKAMTMRAPSMLNLASYVELHSNMPEAEIWRYPLGALLWKSAALAELRGESAADIMTEEEIEIAREQAVAGLSEAGPGPVGDSPTDNCRPSVPDGDTEAEA